MKILRLGVAVAVVLVLSGCFGIGPDTDADPGSGGGEQPTAPDFSQVAPFLLPAESEGRATLGENQTPYGNILNALWWATEYTSGSSVFDILAAWSPDQPGSYSYQGEGPSVLWSETASGFEWVFADSISLTLSDNGSDIDVSIVDTGGAMTVLSGTIAYDALSGSVTFFDEIVYDYSWGPSPISGMDIRIEITYNIRVEETFVIDSTIDGSTGQYFWLSDPGAIYSWPSPPQ